jgi:hypothetical protein
LKNLRKKLHCFNIKLVERTNPFDSSPFEDLGKPEIGELFFSDAMPESFTDEKNKVDWL